MIQIRSFVGKTVHWSGQLQFVYSAMWPIKYQAADNKCSM